jgi:hypothetical protein
MRSASNNISCPNHGATLVRSLRGRSLGLASFIIIRNPANAEQFARFLMHDFHFVDGQRFGPAQQLGRCQHRSG